MNICFFEVQEWERELLIKSFPEAKVTNEKLSAENVSEFQDMEVASSFIYSTFSKEVLEKLPNLKYIATRSTGFDHIDIQTAKEKNIKVSNVPEYGSRTVAEYAFALLLTLTRRIPAAIEQSKTCNYDHNNLKGMDLYEKTLGIVGLGKIGMEVMKIAHGFGMKVLVSTHTQKPELQSQYQFTYVDLSTLLKESDVITLHLPATADTTHTINTDNVKLMKKGVYLINTARGALIDPQALIQGLENDIFGGVGLDVFEGENDLQEELDILASNEFHTTNYKTLCMNHALMNHPKVVFTPHNAFNTQEALVRITNTTLSNIKAFVEGLLQNSVV